MIASLLLAAEVAGDSLSEALQALSDGFASGDLALVIVAAVLAAGLITLKFLGKKIPFEDTIVKAALAVTKAVRKPAPGVAAVVKVEEDGKQNDAVGKVVDIRKDGDK